AERGAGRALLLARDGTLEVFQARCTRSSAVCCCAIEGRRRVEGLVRIEVVHEQEQMLGLGALRVRQRRVGDGRRAALVLIVLREIREDLEAIVEQLEALVESEASIERER